MKIIEKIKHKQADIYGAPPVTIAFLGDSVTQGCFECYKTGEASLETVFDYENSIGTNLRKILNLLYTKVQINIINSGISGDSAPNGLSRFDRDIAPFSPDLVIVGYALNDCGGRENGLAGYTNALRGIFAKIEKLGAEAIFLTPNMMNTGISCHLTDDLFRNLAASFAHLQEEGYLDMYAGAGKAAAEECGVRVCDIYSKWRAMYSGGVDITELLANKLNHPIRELNLMTAYSITETMFNT